MVKAVREKGPARPNQSLCLNQLPEDHGDGVLWIKGPVYSHIMPKGPDHKFCLHEHGLEDIFKASQAEDAKDGGARVKTAMGKCSCSQICCPLRWAGCLGDHSVRTSTVFTWFDAGGHLLQSDGKGYAVRHQDQQKELKQELDWGSSKRICTRLPSAIQVSYTGWFRKHQLCIMGRCRIYLFTSKL